MLRRQSTCVHRSGKGIKRAGRTRSPKRVRPTVRLWLVAVLHVVLFRDLEIGGNPGSASRTTKGCARRLFASRPPCFAGPAPKLCALSCTAMYTFASQCRCEDLPDRKWQGIEAGSENAYRREQLAFMQRLAGSEDRLSVF